MFDKKELIKRLQNDPMYRQALKMAPSDDERRRIIALTEGFLGDFADAMNPAVGAVQQDPKVAAQLRKALKRGAVVKERDGKPVASEVDETKD